MSLRKPPKSTPQRSAASRENGKKSHGPVSAQGKANVGLNVDSRMRGNGGTVPLDVSAQGKAKVSLNALQHGSYSSASARTKNAGEDTGVTAEQHGSYSWASARSFQDTLMALGEAPEEFERLTISSFSLLMSLPSRVRTPALQGQFQVTLNWRNKPRMLLKIKDRQNLNLECL